jgi:hypothetical protein
LYRSYAGNGSDQEVLQTCLEVLGELHDALDAGEGRTRPATRTLVRDGGAGAAAGAGLGSRRLLKPHLAAVEPRRQRGPRSGSQRVVAG